MKDYIEERVLELAHYIIDTKSTVRAAAKKFRVSKSTVHKDVTERLLEINPGLASEVKDVLENNKAERHLRGGEATKQKYERIREEQTCCEDCWRRECCHVLHAAAIHGNHGSFWFGSNRSKRSGGTRYGNISRADVPERIQRSEK